MSRSLLLRCKALICYTSYVILGLWEGPMRRRDVITLLGSASVVCPRATSAQQPMAVIATSAEEAALVAKAATRTVPILFTVSRDPVNLGLVASLAHPSGNVTGINFLASELVAKRLELLRELVPRASRVAVLVNPANATITLRDVEPAARAMGLSVQILNASTGREIDAVFATLVSERVDALLLGDDPFFNSRRVQFANLAAHYSIPMATSFREIAEVGGLMSYGAYILDAYRQVGIYAGRILKGAKPADLPVVQSSKFELVINAQTARSAALLGLIILTVVLGPLWWQVPINDIDFAARLAGPSWQHPFGTDDLGQDLFARLLYGGRISLAVGLAAMLVAVIVGTITGALAGISRGSVDAALMWLTDLFLSLPQLPLLLLIIYLFRDTLKALAGLEAGVFILIVAVIGGFRWMPVARLVRAQFLWLREKEFVEAARALGASTARQVVRNALGPVIVAGTIEVASAIIAESTLSFLGRGFPPDIPTWGRLLYDAKDYLDISPHWALLPGAAIFLTVLTINFIGDGLRDALDPRKVL